MGFAGVNNIVRPSVGTVSDQDARKLLAQHEKLVQMWVNRIWPSAQRRKSNIIDREDLESVGRTALIEAHTSWDETRNVRPATWYSTIIQHRLRTYVALALDTDATENLALMKTRKNRKRIESYAKAHGIKPSEVDPALAGVENLSAFETAAIENGALRQYKSLAQPTAHAGSRDEDAVIEDTLAAGDESAEDIAARKHQKDLLLAVMDEVLSTREKDALLSWFEGAGLRHVASCHNINRQRFSALRANALAKVYYALTGVELDPETSIEACIKQIESFRGRPPKEKMRRRAKPTSTRPPPKKLMPPPLVPAENAVTLFELAGEGFSLSVWVE